MKIVIAPDSFKGSLSAIEAARAIAEGIHRINKNITISLAPLADGGEGTVANLIAATSGTIINNKASDPLGRELVAEYGVLGDGKTCVIETASASGLYLLTAAERNPAITTSFGTGQLIKAALDMGYRKFIIGLGGSATNDGGAGILQALGVKLLDANGIEIARGGINLRNLAEIDLSYFDPRIQESEFIIASDVENTFIGKHSASKVFARQKGADEQLVEQLEANLTHFAELILRKTNIAVHHLPGSGAAGGIGGCLIAFMSGKLRPGIELLIEVIKLEEKLEDASLVITGEGKMDYQTAFGKTPIGVAKVAKKAGVPVVALVGSVGEGVDQLRGLGIESVISIINKPMPLEDALKNSYELLVHTTEQVVRVFLLNQN